MSAEAICTVTELDADRREQDRLERQRPKGFPRNRWTIAQVAFELDITAAQVRKLCRSGELAAERWIGNQWAIPAGAVGDYRGLRDEQERTELVDRVTTLETVIRELLQFLALNGRFTERTMDGYCDRIPKPADA